MATRPNVPPVTPYEEQLLELLGQAQDELASTQLELERVRNLAEGEIKPEATCAFCGIRVRFRLHFNTNGFPTHLQCPQCLAPHRLPVPIS